MWSAHSEASLASVRKNISSLWSKLTYDTNLGAGYRTDTTEQQLRGAPAFSRDQSYHWTDRNREHELHDHYGAPYYWEDQ